MNINLKQFVGCLLLIAAPSIYAAEPASAETDQMIDATVLGTQLGCQAEGSRRLTDKSQEQIKSVVAQCACVAARIKPVIRELYNPASHISRDEKMNSLITRSKESKAQCEQTTTKLVLPQTQILGDWTLRASADCLEHIIYKANGDYQITSRDEVITGHYVLAENYTDEGRLKIDYYDRTSNEKINCQGSKTLQAKVDSSKPAGNSGYLIFDQSGMTYANANNGVGRPSALLGPYRRVSQAAQ